MLRIRSDTLGRAALAVLLYITLTSSHVTAKKRLVPKPTLPTVPFRELDRSPIYESGNQPYYPDDHHDFIGHSVQGHSHEDLGKYRYIGAKKKPQIYTALGPAGPSPTSRYKDPGPQLYTVVHPPSSPRPTAFSNPKTYSVSGVSQSPLQYYSTASPTQEYNTPSQPDSKKYAFAYAVRPKDGYSGDDYSHKESRDGKVTTGEYKVLLPDGRLQVVRYTADALAGFKADVTYEGEENQNQDNSQSAKIHPNSKPTRSPYGEPSSAIHKQFAAPPAPTQSSFPSGPYKPNPIFYANPLTSHPSLSPSLVYKESRQDEHQYQDNHHVDQRFDNNLNPSPPPSPVFYKVSPTPYTLKKVSPTQYYSSQKKSPRPTEPQQFFKFKNSNPTPTPRSIYDKINVSPSPSKYPYSPVPHGHRAGPGNPSPSPTYATGPVYKASPSPTSYDISPAYSNTPEPQSHGRRRTRLLRLTPVEPTRVVSKVISKSKLVPIELFKAGPATSSSKDYRVSPTAAPVQFDIHAHSHELHDHHPETQYFLQDDPHHHQSHQHLETQHHDHHIIEEHHPPHPIPQVKSSLATFTSNFDYSGQGTPKPRLYIKSKPQLQRPLPSGLIYLETPGKGPRPNDIGVKEFLATIPHDNLPRPKTTTHPYEVGSKDYGNNVGYSPSFNDKKSFTPSQEIPPEYLPKLDTQRFKNHHSREFLVNEKQDTVLAYDNDSRSPIQIDRDHVVYSNYEQ